MNTGVSEHEEIENVSFADGSDDKEDDSENGEEENEWSESQRSDDVKTNSDNDTDED